MLQEKQAELSFSNWYRKFVVQYSRPFPSQKAGGMICVPASNLGMSNKIIIW